MNKPSSTQNERPSNVVLLRSEEDRIAIARLNAQHRQVQAIVRAMQAESQKHSRNWMSFEWDAKELVEKKW